MTELARFPRFECRKCETFCNMGMNSRAVRAFFLPSPGCRRILQMVRLERVSAPPPALPFYLPRILLVSRLEVSHPRAKCKGLVISIPAPPQPRGRADRNPKFWRRRKA